MNSDFVRLVVLVARRDYLRTVRRRGFLIATLLLPAGMALIMLLSGAAASSGSSTPSHKPIVVVNESSVALQVDPQLTPDVQLVGKAEADARFQSGDITEYFVIPAAWPTPASVVHIESQEGRSRLLDAISSTSQSELEVMLRTSILRDAGLPAAALGTVLAPITYDSQTPDGQPVSDADLAASFLVPYAFTLVFVLGIFITSGYLLQSVSEEKENRVVEILLSSVPALPLMAGKIVGLGLAGLTQIVIWLLTAVIGLPLLNQQLSINITVAPTTLILTFVLYAVGYLTYGALFAAIGALASSSREAQQFSSFVVLPAIIPVVLVTFFLRDSASPVVWLLTLLPLTAPGAILEVVAIAPSPPWLMVGLSILSQLIVAAVAVFMSGRIFRATVLLYGVRPSVRRIASAVFARS